MLLKSVDYDSSSSLFQITIDESIYLLSYEQIEELKLSENMKIDVQLFEKIHNFSEYNFARASALKYVSRRTLSSHKLFSYLRKKGISETSVYKIINEFSKIGLLDDENYIRNYIQAKKEFNRMSKQMIKFKLQQEGFNSGQLDKLLNEYTEEEELINASKLIDGKFGNINKTDFKTKNKAYQYLYRRGFTNDIINRVILEAED